MNSQAIQAANIDPRDAAGDKAGELAVARVERAFDVLAMRLLGSITMAKAPHGAIGDALRDAMKEAGDGVYDLAYTLATDIYDATKKRAPRKP